MNKPKTRRLTSAIQFSALPATLADALRCVIRRIRRIILIRGLLATFATLLLALLVVMAVDATTVILNDTWRYLLSGGVLAVTLFTAMRRLVIPLSLPFTPVRIAALIERRHPELEERLSTVVQLLSGEQQFIGSKSLFSVVLETACSDVENLDVEEEFTLRTVKPRLVAACAALAILITLFVVSPRPVGRLLLRALAPFAKVGNLYAGMLNVAPGDAHVISGSPFEVTVVAAPTLDSQPFIRFAPFGRIKHETSERMSLVETRPDNSRIFRHLVPSVTESFQYRVMSGFAITRHYQVRSLNCPDVNSLQLQMAFPVYTGQQDVLLTNSLHNLSAIAGTRLIWTATYNRKPMQGELRFNNIPLPGTEISGGGQWATTLTDSGERTWAILLKDAYGYTNNPILHTLRTRRDAPPQVTIASPEERRIELPRFANLTLNCLMVDDFAIVAPSVQWAINNEPYLEVLPITSLEATSDPQTWKATVPLELSKFPLSEALQIRFRVQVSDNLPDYLNGPQKTFSEEIVVVLSHTAKSIAAQIAKEQAEKIEKALKEVERLLEASRVAAEAFEKKQQEGKPTQDPLEALQAVQENLLKAETLAQKTVAQAKQSLYAPIAKELADDTEKNLESAIRQTELAMLAEKETIPEEIRALQAKLKEALEGFRDLQKRNETFAKDLQKLIDLDELAMKEAALSGKADELEKKLNLAALLEEQNALRREVKKPLPHEPETYQVMLEAQKEQLDEMKAEAVHLAAEQEQLRKQTEALKDPALRETVAKALAEKAPAAQQQATPEEQARARQADLARRAEALEAKTRKIQESLRDWGQPTARAAQLTEEAARLLNQAKRQSDDAQSKMPVEDSVKPKPDLAVAQQKAKLLANIAHEAAKAAELSRQREEEAKARAENARAEAEKAKNAVRQTAEQKAPEEVAKAQELVAIAKQAAAEAKKAAEEVRKAADQTRQDAAVKQAVTEARQSLAEARAAAKQAEQATAAMQKAEDAARDVVEQQKAAQQAEQQVNEAAKALGDSSEAQKKAEQAQSAKGEDAAEKVKQAAEAARQAAEQIQEAVKALAEQARTLEKSAQSQEAAAQAQEALAKAQKETAEAAKALDNPDVAKQAEEAAATAQQAAQLATEAAREARKAVDAQKKTAEVHEAAAKAQDKLAEAQEQALPSGEQPADPKALEAVAQAATAAQEATKQTEQAAKEAKRDAASKSASMAHEAAEAALEAATETHRAVEAAVKDTPTQDVAEQAAKQAEQAEAVATETQALADKAGDAAAKSQESLGLAERSAKEAKAAEAEAHKDLNAPAEVQAEHQARVQEAIAQAAEAARQAQEAAALALEAAAQTQEQAMARADEQQSSAEQKASETAAQAESAMADAAHAAEVLAEQARQDAQRALTGKNEAEAAALRATEAAEKLEQQAQAAKTAQKPFAQISAAQEKAEDAQRAAVQAQQELKQAVAKADAASEQMKADLEDAQRTLAQLTALQTEQVTQARKEAGEKPGDGEQQRIGRQQKLAEELVKQTQRMHEESAKPLMSAEALPQRKDPNPLPDQAEAQRSLDQAARSLEQASESMNPLLEQLAKQLGLAVPTQPSTEAMNVIAATQEKVRQAQTRAENLLKDAARPDFSPEQRDQTLDRSLQEQELALGEQKKAEEALAEQQAKSPQQVQEQARAVQQSAKEALERTQSQQTDWKQAQTLSKEATTQANIAMDNARSQQQAEERATQQAEAASKVAEATPTDDAKQTAKRTADENAIKSREEATAARDRANDLQVLAASARKQETDARTAFDRALQRAREKQHDAAVAQIDAGEAQRNRVPQTQDDKRATLSPLPYAMKTEAAMFEAQASWKKLAAMKELEQVGTATSEIQKQAMEQVEAAQRSTDPEAIRVAQQQALDKQQKASETLAQMVRVVQATEAPIEMLQGLKAAQQAQQKATEMQDSAAKAQRDAIRTQQQAQTAREQARSLAEQAQANSALQEQAKLAAANAAQMEQSGQRDAQVARTEQAKVAQAQQQAIRHGSNIMNATQTVREAQKENLRKQADEAVETAAASLQRQAQKLAAQLGIPLSEMPSANASRERQDSSQSAESENEKQANSDAMDEATRGGQKTDDTKAKDSSAEAKEEEAFEMDELMNSDRKSLFPSWFRFPGFHRSEAEAEGWEDVPAEYRGLVRDYFRKLSEEEDAHE